MCKSKVGGLLRRKYRHSTLFYTVKRRGEIGSFDYKIHLRASLTLLEKNILAMQVYLFLLSWYFKWLLPSMRPRAIIGCFLTVFRKAPHVRVINQNYFSN